MTAVGDPFRDSEALAGWSHDTLSKAGLADVASWRMLEYWFQVELYRASGQLTGWSHFGTYEQPYYTNLPRPGSKTKVKWIDLVVAESAGEVRKRMLWLELKDIGRSPHTALNNAKGLGADLAALSALDIDRTIDTWLNPPVSVKDLGRVEEWSQLAPRMVDAEHLLGQIVVCPSDLISRESLEVAWLDSYKQRISTAPKSVHLAWREIGDMSIVALVISHGGG